ncbi:hypothetical protein Q31b_29990 [Novipirellula aureliae]|uniref:Uncharacterized protein n=1 Tax=Novipirellula aureliae TaxID=2527966 RepID=A0A5C6DXY9_9BACT|nr:hypothetical protein [Novipirellula aureliae]TWU41550.1 hypothetical protein Q31b_29990 [Novipirellula aureliae]
MMKNKISFHTLSSVLLPLSVCGTLFIFSSSSSAQIVIPTTPSIEIDRYASLEDQLINRLHAVTEQQQAYIRFVVRQVKEGKLEIKLVVAMERYAIRRRPDFPLPFFERAMRLQAARVGVSLPAIQSFVAPARLAP